MHQRDYGNVLFTLQDFVAIHFISLQLVMSSFGYLFFGGTNFEYNLRTLHSLQEPEINKCGGE